MRRFYFSLILAVAGLWGLAQQISLPNNPDSLHFAVIGDSGTGERGQYEVGDRMVEYRQKFSYDMVLMLGDNIYGGKSARDYQNKFELPYKKLLDAGVKFYAALGNHDEANSTRYKLFNMSGARFYTFKAPKGDVRFFALDSNYMDQAQLAWLEKELKNSNQNWKICFFHHPLYSSGGRHGSDVQLRRVLEPIFVKYGVNVVLSGHDHFYERIKPQLGIYYFVCGAAGQLAVGDIDRTNLTAKGFDRDNHFMLMEVAGDDLSFQTISRTGQTVDSGVLHRQKNKPPEAARISAPHRIPQLRAAVPTGY
ncbi:MAG TPA: metallophosphoesterase [Acidobacteriota bacterium]